MRICFGIRVDRPDAGQVPGPVRPPRHGGLRDRQGDVPGEPGRDHPGQRPAVRRDRLPGLSAGLGQILSRAANRGPVLGGPGAECRGPFRSVASPDPSDIKDLVRTVLIVAVIMLVAPAIGAVRRRPRRARRTPPRPLPQ